MINNIAIGLAMGLIVIGVIAIFISGIKNIINGNSDFKRIAVMVVPVIIFAASFAIMGTFVQAGVATMIFMISLMLLSILVTGTRGTLNF
ncbi:MAG: hypothetical protein GVY07_14490 [Bacteroidetes bacterium]|jgi:ABC-type Na+ efflux pump permease subunit|uniref:Uncharacterized protein n=1 Tax=Rhodohalobacter sulfatireducens TaxID=2911366 RepID=A0ABS9KBS3_9BACT|nr:hypothetical protein [Rhodohalobacter sulfatireducens]MCG2588291.1 hypothetical protein [Rhodohalobacter sulfatireducens]MDR9365741.1 hypothetical protein [Balneolaceae bacterium]MDR9409458.1 hypothetical protein [Balneolaceae bacterium]NBC66850.1 hypothetical protein [Bacteroidota bacterium]